MATPSDAATIIWSTELELAPLIAMVRNRDYFAGARFHVLRGACEHLAHVRDCVRTRARVAARRGRRLATAAAWTEEAEIYLLRFGELRSAHGRIPRLIFWDLLGCYRVSKVASLMMPQVKRLCEEGGRIVRRSKLPQPMEISTGFASRDRTLRAAIERVRTIQPNGIVAIWGRAGLGKTYLLKLVEEYFSRDDTFDLVLRIASPRDSSVAKVQSEIAKKLMLANCDGMQHRARIFDFLKERNFLLLLDCVWQRLDLEEVGIPSLDLVGSCYNRRVVFTACSSHVCDQMNVEVENRIEVHCLDHTESWEIFKQNADLDYLGHQHVYLPRNISAELLGSPLELVTIGKAMHNKKDAIYWQNALHYLTESCLRDTQWSGSEEATFFRLKLAYDSLTGILKDCFKLCSLWPEGHIFNQRKLVDFWIGSGLIQGDDIEASYNEGFSHITTLQEFCLLEPAEDGEAVQMQSTIRDFALWVVHSQGEDKNKWRIQTKENWGLAEQVLLVGLKITELPRIPSNQKTLEVLILQHNYLEDGSFGNFPSLLSLQYLDLSFNKLSNIPVEICMQVNLRYLNLSNNRIKTVPVELGCLTRLRHLHLRNNPNLVIPNGILPKLQNLEVLDVCSFNLLQCSSYEAPINELVRMDKLQSLGITVRSETSFQGISKTTLPIRSLSIVIYNHEDGYETHVSSENSCINPERQTNLFELGIYTRQKTIVLDSIHSMWNVQHVEKAYLHGYFVDRIICQKLHTDRKSVV